MKLKQKLTANWLLIILILAISIFAMEYWDNLSHVTDYILTILSPFIIGGCIAFVLNLPMSYFEKILFTNRTTGHLIKGGRICSILLTLIGIFGIMALVLFMIIPELLRTAGELVDTIADFSIRQQAVLEKLWRKYPQMQGFIQKLEVDWKTIVEGIWEFLKVGISGVVNSTISVVGTIVFRITNFMIGCVFAIYLLFSKEMLGSQGKQVMYAYLKKEKVDGILYVLHLIGDTFASFITGQCVEACILGFMFFITMTVVGLPYPLLIGVVIAITALIPVFGSFLGLGVGLFLLLATDPMDALIFTIMFFILQQLEENLIYPRVVGSSIGLPSIWVMVSVTLGGSLMGIVGMLLFLPMASVLYTLFRNFTKKRNKERH